MADRFTVSRVLWLRLTIICCVCFIVGDQAQAQNPSATTQPATPASSPIAQPTPETKATPSLERRLLKNVLHDQVAIWTAPFSLKGRDALWLAPLGAGTAFLIASDRRTAQMVDSNGSLQPVSRGFSHLGSPYWTGGVAAGFYLFGRARHDARARETGLLAAEALINGGLVVEPLKLITQRPRPLDDRWRGRFFSGGYAFPSGHAMSAWAVATVVANEYGPRHPLARVAAYGLAASISLSRYGGRRHFLSDTAVGSLIGYGIGRYVFFKHHDRKLDSLDKGSDFKAHSKLWPLTTPVFGRDEKNTRQYGLAMKWEF